MAKYWKYCPYCGSNRVVDYKSETEPEMAIAACHKCKIIFHVVRHAGITSHFYFQDFEEDRELE